MVGNDSLDMRLIRDYLLAVWPITPPIAAPPNVPSVLPPVRRAPPNAPTPAPTAVFCPRRDMPLQAPKLINSVAMAAYTEIRLNVFIPLPFFIS
jgi:hypothetical protein